MKIIMPDYSNCLVNLNQSIRKYYNLKTYHNTLESADMFLKDKNYENVVLILFDGMGSKIIDKTLPKSSLLKSKKVSDFLSVFPSTTVAATTSLRSSKTPIETGWLGWHQYFEKYDLDLITFRGEGYYKKDVKLIPNPSYIDLEYKTINEELEEIGIKSHTIFPSFAKDMDHANSIREFRKKIIRYLKETEGNKFLYAYWDQPDHNMHKYGTDSFKIKMLMRRISINVRKIYKRVPKNTIIFIVADHGHINVEHINLFEYKDFLDTLVRLPTIEARNASFYVKEDRKEEFEALFKKYFGNDFILFNKKEIYGKELFGNGIPHPLVNGFIGDYQAAAISNKCFSYFEEEPKFKIKSTHAGITEDEMLIPLIVLRK